LDYDGDDDEGDKYECEAIDDAFCGEEGSAADGFWSGLVRLACCSVGLLKGTWMRVHRIRQF
jgi:hypothetical protein